MRTVELVVLSLAGVNAFAAGVRTSPLLARSGMAMRAPAAATMQMPLEPPAMAHLESAAAALTTLPSTLLADDNPLSFLVGFDTNPLILLLPIGAGTLVASAIIWVLVKSAG